MPNEVLLEDLADAGVANDDARCVAHQLHVKLATCKYKSLKLQNEMEGAAEGENVRVELAVCFVGAERAVGEVAGDRGFLGEGHDVKRRGQVPVVVAPEEACCTESWIIH